MSFTPLARHTRPRRAACCSTRAHRPKPTNTLVLGASFALFPGTLTHTLRSETSSAMRCPPKGLFRGRGASELLRFGPPAKAYPTRNHSPEQAREASAVSTDPRGTIPRASALPRDCLDAARMLRRDRIARATRLRASCFDRSEDHSSNRRHTSRADERLPLPTLSSPHRWSAPPGQRPSLRLLIASDVSAFTDFAHSTGCAAPCSDSDTLVTAP